MILLFASGSPYTQEDFEWFCGQGVITVWVLLFSFMMALKPKKKDWDDDGEPAEGGPEE